MSVDRERAVRLINDFVVFAVRDEFPDPVHRHLKTGIIQDAAALADRLATVFFQTAGHNVDQLADQFAVGKGLVESYRGFKNSEVGVHVLGGSHRTGGGGFIHRVQMDIHRIALHAKPFDVIAGIEQCPGLVAVFPRMGSHDVERVVAGTEINVHHFQVTVSDTAGTALAADHQIRTQVEAEQPRRGQPAFAVRRAVLVMNEHDIHLSGFIDEEVEAFGGDGITENIAFQLIRIVAQVEIVRLINGQFGFAAAQIGHIGNQPELTHRRVEEINEITRIRQGHQSGGDFNRFVDQFVYREKFEVRQNGDQVSGQYRYFRTGNGNDITRLDLDVGFARQHDRRADSQRALPAGTFNHHRPQNPAQRIRSGREFFGIAAVDHPVVDRSDINHHRFVPIIIRGGEGYRQSAVEIVHHPSIGAGNFHLDQIVPNTAGTCGLGDIRCNRDRHVIRRLTGQHQFVRIVPHRGMQEI